MIVIVVSNCPPSLRGDLTLWLQEIATGVYVGHVSARVRDRLWDRVVENIRSGQATLVYSADNEQGHRFRVHGTTWEVIDHEGLELILKPSEEAMRKRSQEEQRPSSKAAQHLAARKATRSRQRRRQMPADYVVVDVETSGLSPKKDVLIEIACLKVENHEVVASFSSLIYSDTKVPDRVIRLTGIDSELLLEEGRPLEEVLPEFLDILGDSDLVAHNAKFDLGFIYAACERLGIPRPPGRTIDTLNLARRQIMGVSAYTLEALVEHYGLEVSGTHRALDDCHTTMEVYKRLSEDG